jgi:multidrug efflux pump subunit AcrB
MHAPHAYPSTTKPIKCTEQGSPLRLNEPLFTKLNFHCPMQGMLKIFQFFVNNWRFTFMMKVIVILAGVMGLMMMNREAFPPVNFAQVSISTTYQGASPQEVEDQITNILEEELKSISGIKEVLSVSKPDRSDIDVRVDIDRKDSDKVIDEVQRAVQRARGRLPVEVTEDPFVLEIKADEFPIIEMALVNSENLHSDDLHAMAYKFKKNLEDIDGVASVRLSGYQEREYQVILDPRKLKHYEVGIPEVSQALAAKVRNVPTGYIRNENETEMVRVLSPVTTAKSIDELVVRSPDFNNSIQIKDIGRAQEGRKIPTVLARYNGSPAVLIVVTKKGEADAIRLVGDVKTHLDALKAKLPNNFRVEVYNDEGQRVINRLEIVTDNAGIGFIVVLLILFLFLPYKIGLLSAMSLPLCVFGTAAAMVWQGANFNVITMMALIICLGNLVDNSVVISEYYTRLREDGMPGPEAAAKSAHQFWIPFTASTITIIAAFLPMLMTKGVMGQFIKWIPITVTAALIVSLFEALFLLPSRLQFIGVKDKKDDQRENAFARLENGFTKMITWTVHHHWKTFFALIALVVSGFVATGLFNRFELFPADGIEYYVAKYETPVQTSIYKTDRFAKVLSEKIEEKLKGENFTAYVSRTGIQQVDVSDPQMKIGENVGFVLIGVTPNRAQYVDVNQVLETLRTIEKPAGIEKLSFENMANGPPIGKPVTLRIRSENEPQLQKAVQAALDHLKTVAGVFNIETDEQATGKEVALQIDETRSAAVQLTTDAIGSNLRSAFQGFMAGKITREGEEIEVNLRIDESKVKNVRDLHLLELMNGQGQLIPIQKVAKFNEQEAPKFKKRYEFKRNVTVTAEVKSEQITSQAANASLREFIEKVAGEYPEVMFKFGGEEESTNESMASLGLALLLAMIGIFATLVFIFHSFSKPLLILSSIPLGLIGVCYAFILDQRPLSFIAFIGVVGLSGVVINSAIILVDYIEELRKKYGDEKPLQDILVLASTQRLRAVLATGLTTVVGLLPAAWGLGGYDSLLVPMTLALSWGMIVGTVASLFWIPSTYLILEKWSRKKKK